MAKARIYTKPASEWFASVPYWRLRWRLKRAAKVGGYDPSKHHESLVDATCHLRRGTKEGVDFWNGVITHMLGFEIDFDHECGDWKAFQKGWRMSEKSKSKQFR